MFLFFRAKYTPTPTIANKYKKFPGSESVLDHIFCKEFEPGSRGIASEALASDHYPIWAVFEFPPEMPD